ncbi:hypothetical protein L484_007727 [Morus notabilis]|uniref:Uncharacterized protein n=1 Tax=Morus notabilis TaxID=981085 RepID=W9R3Y0_9ROSA|nr:hypothetical protein L484_007727 [Morus notabilis]
MELEKVSVATCPLHRAYVSIGRSNSFNFVADYLDLTWHVSFKGVLLDFGLTEIREKVRRLNFGLGGPN